MKLDRGIAALLTWKENTLNTLKLDCWFYLALLAGFREAMRAFQLIRLGDQIDNHIKPL